MAAFDQFPYLSSFIDAPATHAQAVTPNDAVDLTNVSRALWVGGGGDVKVTMLDGTTLTFVAMTIGWHPLRVSRVWATLTTATSIVAVS